MDIGRILNTLEYGPALEGTEPVVDWLESHKNAFGLLIGGEWRRPGGGDRLLEAGNPVTGELLARLTQATAGDVDAAVRAARAAFSQWSALPGHERARHLYALARKIQRSLRLLAVLQTLESGRVIRQSMDHDIPLVARCFESHAGWASLIARESPDYRATGVVGQITAAGTPFSILAQILAPALAAGNTVVLKPAPETSLVALAFGQLCLEAGLPPGVVNVVTGDESTGEWIADHKEVDLISLAGSAKACRAVRQRTAGSGKRLILDVVGGETPFLVFDDADVESAIEGLAGAVGFERGGICCPRIRLLVQESIAQGFADRLRRRLGKLRSGDPLDRGVDCAGPSPADAGWVEEFAGRVLAAGTFRTPGEAVELANETGEAAAASIWTEGIGLALDIASRVKAGTVWINHVNLFDAATGLGARRVSGSGRVGGIEGLTEYMRPRWEGAAGQPTEGTGDAGGAGALELAGSPVDSDGPEVDSDALGDAVKAALAAARWGIEAAERRARLLRGMAENLSMWADEFSARVARATGREQSAVGAEVEAAIERLFAYAASAGTFAGVARPAAGERAYTLALPEPLGVVGIVCPGEAPLLALVSLAAPAIAVGNAVVAVVQGERFSLPVLDLQHLFSASGLPTGVINVVSGPSVPSAIQLAGHRDVDALWYFGPPEGWEQVEAASSRDLKRVWVGDGRRDWFAAGQPVDEEVLRRATQVKHLWIPYGA